MYPEGATYSMGFPYPTLEDDPDCCERCGSPDGELQEFEEDNLCPKCLDKVKSEKEYDEYLIEVEEQTK